MSIIKFSILLFSTFFLFSHLSAKSVDMKKTEKEVRNLISRDWSRMVSNRKTLDFCSSYLIKTNHQLGLLPTKPQSTSDYIPYLAKEKISCLNSPKEVSLFKLAKRAKKIMRQYKLSTSIEDKWLEMRPYHINRELFRAITKDKLDLYFRLLAYGAFYGNTAIGDSVLNLALSYESYKMVEYFFKVEKTNLNWTTNGGRAPLTILIDHKKVRYDLLEYALKHLKANPNYNGELRSYPIQVALNNKDEKSMALLIKYGAKLGVEITQSSGCEQMMLMDQAIKRDNKGIIKLLRKSGAKTYKECLLEE